MSSHYKTGEPLSEELVDKLIKRSVPIDNILIIGFLNIYRLFLNISRYTNVGLFYLRQGFFATFDMKVHTDQGKLPFKCHSLCWLFTPSTEEEDYTKLWNTLRESISLVKNDKTFKPGQGSFGHLMGGYDAGYYGYMYSLVFAADMYATVFKKDPLNPELGPLTILFIFHFIELSVYR